MILDSQRIAQRVAELAWQLDEAFDTIYEHKPLVMLVVLKGAVYFAVDLSRAMTTPMELQFISASSYGDAEVSKGLVKLSGKPDVKGRDVLIVEDIIDTGLTIEAVIASVMLCQPHSVSVVALLSKKARRLRPLDDAITFVGFEIADVFVVGYGMDKAGLKRNLVSVWGPE